MTEECTDPTHDHATEDQLVTLETLLGMLANGVVALQMQRMAIEGSPDRDKAIEEFNGVIYSLWSVCRALATHYEDMYGLDEADVKGALQDIEEVLEEAGLTLGAA